MTASHHFSPKATATNHRAILTSLLFGLTSIVTQGLTVSEITYQGRDQFLVRTEQATYYFDRAGGGFSRLIDRDGRDWIDFSKDPLKSYPASAAAGYRGMPNLVFGSQNPDAGAGHPGFDQCESILVGPDTIRTTSKSKKWRWSWHFREDGATFTMEQNDPEHAWWFLYEGPIAGSFQPSQKFWATNTLGVSGDIPTNQNQLFGQWQWVYFGDRRTPHVLYLVQHEEDSLPDTLWYLGSSDRGSATAPDGMMVFGFGRGPGTKPQFRSSQVSISLGFLDADPVQSGPPISKRDHEQLRKEIRAVPSGMETKHDTTHGIEIWYGPQQRFGSLGIPQRWVNLLGHVNAPGQLVNLSYQLDAQTPLPVSVGTDLHRLALPGDFNVEIAYDDLTIGDHSLALTATYRDGTESRSTTQFNVQKNTNWPLPYRVNFRETKDLQSVVQIVDGRWHLTESGVRTTQCWYDRVLSLGDTTWKNYDARVLLTIHDHTPSQRAAPTYGVTHFGVALRWQGHSKDGRQPSRRWYPLGAQGEFLLSNDLTENRFRILHNGGAGWKPSYGEKRHTVQREHPFWIRAQVFTAPDGQTNTYRFKQWNHGEPEPTAWSVTSSEPSETDLSAGALCLVPHNSDVTIHQVSVEPLP